jgi:DNA repair protein RAD50
MCGEKEVLAQVKLQFRNASGNKLVITRSMSATAKKGGVTQKTLESQLVMYNKGERTSMSTKVGELNTIIPQYLGVSAAILDNVIFCHQDESLWPMSEPSKLKVKFDEIFAAQKYTKAIEIINKMRKAHNDELKKYVIQEANYKSDKDKSERLQQRSMDLEREIEVLREQEQILKRDMNAADEIATEKKKLANKAFGIVEELKTKNQRAEYLEDTVNELRESLVELGESDEWLESTLAQYEERMELYNEQLTEYNSQFAELKESLRDFQRQLSAKQGERGQHQAQKDSYEQQLLSRVQLVKEAARTHSMRGYDGDLEDDQISEFVQRVQKLLQEKDRELERIRKATSDEVRQTQSVISSLENRQATKTQEKVNARQTISSNDRKSNSLQSQLSSINVDEGAKAALEVSLNDTQARLSRATSAYEAANWDSSINIENNRLNELENESNRLNSELMQCTKDAKDRGELDYSTKTLKQTQQALDTLLSTYSEQLNSLLGTSWRAHSIDSEFQTLLEQRTSLVAEAKKLQEGSVSELNQLDFKIKENRSNLARMKEERQKCHTAVLNSITTVDGRPLSSIDDYLEELAVIDKDRRETRQDLDGVVYVNEYYQKAIATANGKNCCQLCERSFANEKEQLSATAKLTRLIAKNVREDLEKDLEALERDFKKADAARSQFDTYKRLHDIEIPKLDIEFQKMDTEKNILLKRLQNRDIEVRDAESSKRDAEALTGTVNSITKYSQEITKFEKDILRLSSQQKLSGSLLTVEEIQEQQSACTERSRTVRAKRDKLVADKDRAKSEIPKLELEISSITNRLNRAQNELEKKQSLLATMEELRESTIQQRNAINQADVDLESLESQFAKAKAQHEDAQQRGQSKQRQVEKEKEKLAQTVNKFKLVEDSINSYIESGGPGKLAICERAIKLIEKDQKRIDAEIATVTKAANDIKDHISASDTKKQSIQQNIRFRKALRDLQNIKEEIAELESRNVTDDYEELHREMEAAALKYQTLSAQRGPVIGAMASKDDELTNMLEQWKTDYQDAAEKYKEMHILVETTKAAVEDMKKYSQALDNAIMKYHSLKMEEINSIAGQLWIDTYQGTDVDTIMIRSENDTASSTSTRKSYNYRLVMAKQDAEMDMRGRCSAGQRVLASIIIRLALAECFGINCGVGGSSAILSFVC